jgi:hypothetical protein
MPDRLDFGGVRDLLEQIVPSHTWDDAAERATRGTLVSLDTNDVGGDRRQPHLWLVAIAACLLVVVVIAAIFSADHQSVDTIPPVGSPTTAPGAGTIIAKGRDIGLEGTEPDSLGGQILQIDVEEIDGQVTGEFHITNIVNTVECVDTETDGIVILGGRVTTTDPAVAAAPALGDLHALIIKEGDPDGVHLYGNDVGAETCTELLESIPADLLADDREFIDVIGGNDIETG